MSLAALDAVLCPEWDYRYYSYNSEWGQGLEMASMRNGAGDDWFAVICPSGVAVVGLAHEADCFTPGRPPPWVFEALPEPFHIAVLREPAFDIPNSTYCVWRQTSDEGWNAGAAPAGLQDGSTEHLAILSGGCAAYVAFARDYYEVEVDEGCVRDVYGHVPLDPSLAARLNSEVDYTALQRDLREIGYPVAG